MPSGLMALLCDLGPRLGEIGQFGSCADLKHLVTMRLKEGFAMSFFQRLFGASRPAASIPSSAPESQTHSHLSSGASQRIAASQNTTRREMLRVVLRETLQRHGIPV